MICMICILIYPFAFVPDLQICWISNDFHLRSRAQVVLYDSFCEHRGIEHHGTKDRRDFTAVADGGQQVPGLVNVYRTNWKITMLLMGKSTISMVIFNSYVKLPEGKWSFSELFFFIFAELLFSSSSFMSSFPRTYPKTHLLLPGMPCITSSKRAGSSVATRPVISGPALETI